jgi:hypothetical protein
MQKVVVHFQPHRGSLHRVTFNADGTKPELVESQVVVSGLSWRTLWRDGGAKRMSTGVACAIRGARKKLADSMGSGVAPIVSNASGAAAYR